MANINRPRSTTPTTEPTTTDELDETMVDEPTETSEAEDEFAEFNTELTQDEDDEREEEVDLSKAIDNAADDEERKKFFTPTGDYLKREDWTKKVWFDDDDMNPKDKYYVEGRGRFFIDLSGQADSTKSGETYFFFLRISPDSRIGKNDKLGRPDMFYQNYDRVRQLYLRMNEEVAKTYDDLVKMMVGEQYIISNRVGNNGAFITGFKLKGQR